MKRVRDILVDVKNLLCAIFERKNKTNEKRKKFSIKSVLKCIKI